MVTSLSPPNKSERRPDDDLTQTQPSDANRTASAAPLWFFDGHASGWGRLRTQHGYLDVPAAQRISSSLHCGGQPEMTPTLTPGQRCDSLAEMSNAETLTTTMSDRVTGRGAPTLPLVLFTRTPLRLGSLWSKSLSQSSFFPRRDFSPGPGSVLGLDRQWHVGWQGAQVHSIDVLIVIHIFVHLDVKCRASQTPGTSSSIELAASRSGTAYAAFNVGTGPLRRALPLHGDAGAYSPFVGLASLCGGLRGKSHW